MSWRRRKTKPRAYPSQLLLTRRLRSLPLCTFHPRVWWLSLPLESPPYSGLRQELFCCGHNGFFILAFAEREDAEQDTSSANNADVDAESDDDTVTVSKEHVSMMTAQKKQKDRKKSQKDVLAGSSTLTPPLSYPRGLREVQQNAMHSASHRATHNRSVPFLVSRQPSPNTARLAALKRDCKLLTPRVPENKTRVYHVELVPQVVVPLACPSLTPRIYCCVIVLRWCRILPWHRPYHGHDHQLADQPAAQSPSPPRPGLSKVLLFLRLLRLMSSPVRSSCTMVVTMKMSSTTVDGH
jgi:hypothetical protein